MTHGDLALAAAPARIDDRRREASLRRIKRQAPPTAATADMSPVTLRFGGPDETDGLARLAALDSSRPPAQPVLLAETKHVWIACLSAVGCDA